MTRGDEKMKKKMTEMLHYEGNPDDLSSEGSDMIGGLGNTIVDDEGDGSYV